jgi:hypothetical protein
MVPAPNNQRLSASIVRRFFVCRHYVDNPGNSERQPNFGFKSRRQMARSAKIAQKSSFLSVRYPPPKAAIQMIEP